ncbi:xanthine dehydrogenase family protein molybdopterin-binding subunit [Eleftheria terrae]|uniref:xanthine dehydrogenase family protein molybdopterin-binding subunit n=1 Tax=Eleftheria terrae TaxID=1597781 RepID=UPI00263BA03F|nr:xanthine dehydrogenase family protein molybdopterin-binding subunit [Eleftheria terrae]WKB53606.1 xanthine dehydrogenase family protein molybdopterin-binding subunit [Eleftheria terrae]
MNAESRPERAPATAVLGQPIDRVDGPLKVCGQAHYVGDLQRPGMAHAVLLLSSIARGRVAGLDSSAALALPGVLAVMTHENAPRVPDGGRAGMKPPAGRTLFLLQDDQVHHDRQPIAVVVAETLEAAREAAQRVQVRYEPAPACLDPVAGRAAAHAPKAVQGRPADSLRGDLQLGWQQAVHRVEASYATPTEHHNPLETHATLAEWQGDRLVLHDTTQYVQGVRDSVAQRLGLPPGQVQVINAYVGGAFGCKGSAWSHVVLAAMAARQVGRPVRLVLERPQMFGPVGHRPATEQRLRLGADAGGRLTAIEHQVHAETARVEDWTESAALLTRSLYACEHVGTSHRLVPLDIAVPTFMRAPGESTGSFALECAIDELAVAAGLDPLEFRLRNHAAEDADKGLPYSSKSLVACYRQAAERFGWQRRPQAPRPWTDGDWQVGWGMATATYPANRMPAEALARWEPNGRLRVQCASHDLGTGTYTVLTQVAADTLGLPPQRVTVEIGDSDLPRAPVSGGSMTVASVGSAVQAACLALRERLVALAVADADSPVYQLPHEQVALGGGRLQACGAAGRGEPVEALLARHGGRPLEARAQSRSAPADERHARQAFGAVFAEVRIDRTLGEIRVPRIVGAYAVGRLLNAKTGRSQLMGGIVWGVSMALHEHSLRDPRYGRIANANLAEYHLPVNADVADIEVIVVPEDDVHVNPLGAKGVGEIGITGVAAAVANAVWHATGKRVRELPIRVEHLL